MDHYDLTRREFGRSLGGLTALGTLSAYWLNPRPAGAFGFAAANDRPLVAAIGVGGRGMSIAKQAARFGDVVAVCDVDLSRAGKAKETLGGKAEVYQDYRKLLDRKDVEVVINGTTDHWHTAVNVAACRAGKDVYTEKPLTLTIDEGKLLRRVVQETGRIVQVGAQQKSDEKFRLACRLVRNGRVGKLRQVIVTLPFWNTKGGPFATKPVPPELDWDLWQGQAPEHEFCPERLHFNFRWWQEYAGGIITDWGQHHVGIAQWGMDMERSGPLTIEGRAIFPNRNQPECRGNCYNNPDRFLVRMTYAGGIEMWYFVVRDEKYWKYSTPEEDRELFAGVPEEIIAEKRNGIMFVGDQGRVFCNRGNVQGKPVEELAENPLPAGANLLNESNDHMENFFQCVKSRQQPVAPVEVEHRTITACHLGNIAIRLGRKITWDPQQEAIVGDPEAAQSIYVRRTQRRPYTIEA